MLLKRGDFIDRLLSLNLSYCVRKCKPAPTISYPIHITYDPSLPFFFFKRNLLTQLVPSSIIVHRLHFLSVRVCAASKLDLYNDTMSLYKKKKEEKSGYSFINNGPLFIHLVAKGCAIS